MAYETKITKLFKGRGLRAKAFPNEVEKQEVRQHLDERIAELQDRWSLITRNDENALLAEEKKKVKIINLGWGIFNGGPSIFEVTADLASIKKVRILMNPPHVSSVRDAGDTILNPSDKRSVSIYVKFYSEGNPLIYDVVDEEKVPINTENLTSLVTKAGPQLAVIRAFFGGKIVLDETAGPRQVL